LLGAKQAIENDEASHKQQDSLHAAPGVSPVQKRANQRPGQYITDEAGL
jgi:hypothetical protein